MPALRTDDDTQHPAESLLGEIADLITAELSASGIPEAKSMGSRCAGRIAVSLGGSVLYIPKNEAGKRLARNVEIRRRHDGTTASVRALAKEFNLSEIALYRILASRQPCATRRPA